MPTCEMYVTVRIKANYDYQPYEPETYTNPRVNPTATVNDIEWPKFGTKEWSEVADAIEDEIIEQKQVDAEADYADYCDWTYEQIKDRRMMGVG